MKLIDLTEGDHIKITASKYPFPTVCAVNQSVDWFQSIGRTLKWNERERQKSFVVVEESPLKKHHKSHRSETEENKNAEEETLDDEEEDEVSDEEEEEEKYDIDDLSASESSKTTPDKTSPESETFSGVQLDIAQDKAAEEQSDQDQEDERVREAARALAKGTPMLRKYARSRSRSGVRSGLDTPDRFVGPHPHPPKLSPRHVAFAHGNEVPLQAFTSPLAASAMERDATVRSGERGARDDLHSPRTHLGARSRIPHDRDIEGDMLRTPTAAESSRARSPQTRRRRSRERSSHVDFDSEAHPRRAFAVLGNDESDSATSDSDC